MFPSIYEEEFTVNKKPVASNIIKTVGEGQGGRDVRFYEEEFTVNRKPVASSIIKTVGEGQGGAANIKPANSLGGAARNPIKSDGNNNNKINDKKRLRSGRPAHNPDDDVN
jgi:hypothetical protein